LLNQRWPPTGNFSSFSLHFGRTLFPRASLPSIESSSLKIFFPRFPPSPGRQHPRPLKPPPYRMSPHPPSSISGARHLLKQIGPLRSPFFFFFFPTRRKPFGPARRFSSVPPPDYRSLCGPRAFLPFNQHRPFPPPLPSLFFFPP